MITFRFYGASRWAYFYFASYAFLIGMVLYSTVALHHPIRAGRISPQPFEALAESIVQASEIGRTR